MDVDTGSAVMIAGEANGGALIAMTAGSRLEVVGMDGAVRLSKDLGAAITTRDGSAVKLQPGGSHVACDHACLETAELVS